ncbi:MAG: hypothetical protein II888_02235 [Clostridia bacterium]|nr:hypothetical protein [Clostridia bacterium]
MKYRRILCAALAAVWIWNGGSVSSCGEEAELREQPQAAEELTNAEPAPDWLEEKGISLGESSLAYPALREGTVPEELRKAVNDRILEDGNVLAYVNRVSQLISGGKLTVSWRGTLLGPVFSFALSAEGAVTSPRPTQIWTGGNVDLRDGHEVTWEELFLDPEAARQAAENYLEEKVAPDLSAHLQNSLLTPAPELFRMTERGIILMYPIEQLSTLSDRAGDVLIPWDAVWDQLNPAEDSVVTAMGIRAPKTGEAREEAPERDAGEAIRRQTEEGTVPGIPVRLGEALQPLTEEWHLLTDPDVYALGRMFALEGAEFRGVFLLTDYLTEEWSGSRVDGIRVDLGSFCGLTVGKTSRETWLTLLGEPESSLEFDSDRAEAYQTLPGTRDYYAFGEHHLQLHGDENGILISIILTE